MKALKRMTNRNRRGQTSFMVMMMMIIAILMALFYWFSAGSQYAQNALSAANNRGQIFGRTGGDVIAVGVGRQAGANQGLPGGAFTPNPPLSPIPPQPGVGPIQPGAPGGAAPAPNGVPPGQPGGAAPAGLSPQLGRARGGFVTDAPWMATLFQQLQSKLGAVPGQIIEMPPIQLSDLGAQVKAYMGANVPGLTIDKVEAQIVNVRRDLAFATQGVFDDKSYYREPLFGDGNTQAGPGKDVRPHDFLADLVVTFTVRSTSGGQSVSRQYVRSMDVRIADTTPVAREFAAFVYEPPHTENYMMNDLNGPGWMAILPNAKSRVMVRGPLVLRPEDAAAEIGLGAKVRTEQSANWISDEQGAWHGFAAVPAPRAVDMPKMSFTISDLVSSFAGIFGGDKGVTEFFDKPSQRPKDKKTAIFENPIPFLPDFPGVWLVGIVPDYKGDKINMGGSLAGFAGVYQPLPPSQTIALAGPSAYYVGTVPVGQQKFTITGISKKMQENMRLTLPSGTDPNNLINPYQGLVLHTTDQSAQASYTQRPVPIGKNKVLAGANQTEVTLETDDVLSCEPAYYASARGTTRFANGVDPTMLQQAAGDQGIYGLYAIANYNRTIYWMFDIPSLIGTIKRLIQATGLVSSILTGGVAAPAAIASAATAEVAHRGALAAVKEGSKRLLAKVSGLKKAATLALIPMNYKVEVPEAPSTAWRPSEQDEKYTLAPYGMYYDDGTGSWLDEGVRDIALASTAIGLNWGIKKLFTFFKGKPAQQADDLAKTTQQRQTAELAGKTDDATALANKESQLASAKTADAAADAAKTVDDAKQAFASARGRVGGLTSANNRAQDAARQAEQAFDAARRARIAAEQGTNIANQADRVAELSRLRGAERAAEQAAEAAGSKASESAKRLAEARAAMAEAQDAIAVAARSSDDLARAGTTAASGADDAIRSAETALKSADDALAQANAARDAFRKELANVPEGTQLGLFDGPGNAAKAAQLDDAVAAATAQQRAAAEALDAARGTSVASNIGAAESKAAEATVQGGTGIINRITGGTKKFASNVWNKFKTGGMSIGFIFPKLLNVLQKNGLNNSTVGFGIAIGLVKHMDNHFLRGHTEETRNKLKPSMAPAPTAATAQETKASLERDFPKGYLPPKYRYFPTAYAFSYKTMRDYLAQFGNVDGAQIDIYLNGIVRVDDLNYDKKDQTIVYHGRGVIVGIPNAASANQNPTFNVKAVRAADDNSYLTLVYEAPNVDVERDGGVGQLQMGPEFTGTIVSSQGVKPAQGVGTTIIHGNLVCRHLNKSKMASDSEAVIVNYSVDRMNGLGFDLGRWWSVSVSPRPSGFTAGQ